MRALKRCARNSLHGSPSKLAKALLSSDCIKVKSGISQQYLYRSMYSIQIAHCMKSFSSDRFLILSSESLRLRPNHTLSQVLEFVGISSDSDTVNSYLNSPQELVDRQFPGFETSTGWRLTSQYDAIPSTLEKDLKEFFMPINEQLFELLGMRFNEWM